jgi:hypothetical protein
LARKIQFHAQDFAPGVVFLDEEQNERPTIMKNQKRLLALLVALPGLAAFGQTQPATQPTSPPPVAGIITHHEKRVTPPSPLYFPSFVPHFQ